MLSESEIVSVAARLTREVGLDNLSMRALARELGAQPMTIYNYLPSKEALQERVVDHVLSGIRIPEPSEGSWEERLRRILLDSRRAFAEHPGIAIKLASRGSAESTRLTEGFLAILRDAGFGPEDTVLCFATFFTFTTGQINLDELDKGMVDHSPTEPLKGVTRSAPYTSDELFEFGLDVVIEGLKLKLSHP